MVSGESEFPQQPLPSRPCMGLYHGCRSTRLVPFLRKTLVVHFSFPSPLQSLLLAIGQVTSTDNANAHRLASKNNQKVATFIRLSVCEILIVLSSYYEW